MTTRATTVTTMTTEAERLERIRLLTERRTSTSSRPAPRPAPARASRVAATGLGVSLMLGLMGRMAAADRSALGALPPPPAPLPGAARATAGVAPAYQVQRVAVDTVTRVVPAAPVARSHGSR